MLTVATKEICFFRGKGITAPVHIYACIETMQFYYIAPVTKMVQNRKRKLRLAPLFWPFLGLFQSHFFRPRKKRFSMPK